MYSSQKYGSQAVSSDHEVVDPSQLSSESLRGWQAPSVAKRQHVAYLSLLKEMYQGNPRQDFVVAAQALRLASLPNPRVLEIGCGNGYYSEVLPYLSGRRIEYVGLDYSHAMIESAREQYPHRQFIIGDAILLPFADNFYDIVWSGTILMHLRDYERAIAETCRVARRFCIFHSTPVLADGHTTFLSKKAYGTTVVEVIMNQVELENLLHDYGLVIRHVLESLPYDVGGVVAGTVNTLTYVCEKGSVT
jgi:SAM-dependent methyltransferase